MSDVLHFAREMKCAFVSSRSIHPAFLPERSEGISCDRYRLSATLISLHYLFPSFVCHATTQQLCYSAASLLRFQCPLPRHRVVAVRKCTPSRLSAGFALTSSSLSLPSTTVAASIAALDLHVDVILMCIAQLCATFPLMLRVTIALSLVYNEFWQCLRMLSCYLNDRDHLAHPISPLSLFTLSYAVAHHQERGTAGEYLPPSEAQRGFFLRSSLPLPLFPSFSFPLPSSHKYKYG
ncbi:hypothetical protein K438DRAFT_1990218 [Mycena galopus ATCC 62051]|nr:hypothetical protein K438DRAFT_1990218 [Mycena galopus ATCC 62051]